MGSISAENHLAIFSFLFLERKEKEREREHVSGGEGQKEREKERERERESQAGSMLHIEPNKGLDSTTLGSRPELKSRLGILNP